MFSPFREPTTRTDNSLKKEAPLTVSLQPGIESPLFYKTITVLVVGSRNGENTYDLTLQLDY